MKAMHPLFFCRCRLVYCLPFLALLLLGVAQGKTPVFAQTAEGAPAEVRQGDNWNKSLRGAALQLAATSLSDSEGGIAPPLRLPQRIVILPLFVERAPGRGALPIAEPVLRARFADCLASARYGDIAVFTPLSPRETARIARLTPSGVGGKNAKLDKTLDAARKAQCDYVLHGTITPSSGKAWLLTVYLVSVNRVGSSEDTAPNPVKAAVYSTLRFTESDR